MSIYIFSDRIDGYFCGRQPYYFVCCAGYIEQETRFNFREFQFLDRCFYVASEAFAADLHIIKDVLF